MRVLFYITVRLCMLQAQMNVDIRQKWKVQDSVLLKANVIAGTLSSIGGITVQAAFKPRARPNKGFDCIIIDEVRIVNPFSL